METYDEIYKRMQKKYEQESGVQFDEASDIAIRLRVLAGEIYNAYVNMEWIKRQMFIDTATGERLDSFARQRGLERKPAKKAKGDLGFYIDETIDHTIVIPKGTVVATADEVPIRFVTTEATELPPGSYFDIVNAEAEKPGSNGNIAAEKAVVAVDVPSEIEYVKNTLRFEDGSDEESDDELRRRIKDSYLKLPNGTNGAYYEQLALTVDGITKTKAVGKARGFGTVNVYVSGDGRESSAGEVNEAQKLIDYHRELNVDVQVIKAEFQSFDLNVLVYKKEDVSADEVKSKCKQAFEDFIWKLEIGQKLYLSALGKALFDTGCILNYEFNVDMKDTSIVNSKCFKPGNVSVTVK